MDPSLREAVLALPRHEKLNLLEVLWADLSSDSAELISPSWHADELAATHKRIANGLERIYSLEEAMQRLSRPTVG